MKDYKTKTKEFTRLPYTGFEKWFFFSVCRSKSTVKKKPGGSSDQKQSRRLTHFPGFFERKQVDASHISYANRKAEGPSALKFENGQKTCRERRQRAYRLLDLYTSEEETRFGTGQHGNAFKGGKKMRRHFHARRADVQITTTSA